MQPPPITYVCLLSQYPTASAQAIKLIRPKSVIALSSAAMLDSGCEKRFTEAVEKWDVEITILGSGENAFPAESLRDSAEWMHQHIGPLLKDHRRQGRRLIANLTGSTKAAALALNQLLDWDERHYTAEGARDRLEAVGHPSGPQFSLPPLGVLEEALLLNDLVRHEKDPWHDRDAALVLAAAEAIYEDYRLGKEDSVLRRNEGALRALWFSRKDEDSTAALCAGGIQLADGRAWVSPGALQDLLRKVAGLDPLACSLDGERMEIPASRQHPWSRFVAGTWWEHLVAAWAKRYTLECVSGVKILRSQENGKTGVDSESDILLRRSNGGFAVIECKVDSPDANKLTEIAWKMGDRRPFFGKAFGAISVSPAFWWNASDAASSAFRDACKQRNFTLLETEEDFKEWAPGSTASAVGECPAIYFPAPPCRAYNAILNEAEMLVFSWKEGSETRLRELQAEMEAGYPGEGSQIEEVMRKRERVQSLRKKAYNLGLGIPKYDWNSILSEARGLNLPRLESLLLESRSKGESARDRALGPQHSTVRPRSHQAQATRPVLTPSPKIHLPPPPLGLHPNDIRALAPSPAWTLLLDETGADFGGERLQSGRKGRFVGLLVRNANSGLPDLQSGWHAVDCRDVQQMDAVIQAVLDAPCGILGLKVEALPETVGERWLDGMRALLDWTLRLLPLDGPTQLDVAIEARPPFKPGTVPDTVCRDAIAMLARSWPERAKFIDLRAKFINKDQHPQNGYVDALAFIWGSSGQHSKDCLRRSGLLNTCFLDFNASHLAACWDHWDRPGGVDPVRWAALVTTPAASDSCSLVSALLGAVAAECRADIQRWTGYLEETRRHLYSGAVDIAAVGAMTEWLDSAKPPESTVPPLVQLVWLTAKLARVNHLGRLEQEWMEKFQELSLALRVEAAPLCCHADLHLAVNATNRFDFALAAELLKLWEGVLPAVPGLRYWGQLHSSIGQHHAFLGNFAAARESFATALGAFEQLSDPAEKSRNIVQTACYDAIVAMDDPSLPAEEVRALVTGLTGYLPEFVASRAASSKDKYVHHILLRWLVTRGDEATARAYVGAREQWQASEGHPWPLILLYRGILLRGISPREALQLAMDAAANAFHAEQGPTVTLIGACCRKIAEAWGEPWPEAAACLDSLKRALPMAAHHIEALAEPMEPHSDPILLLQRVLPFNFR